jgi:hypothetical protein
VEIVIQEKTGTQKPKLTVAGDEIRIKLPKSLSEELKNRLIIFSKSVAKSLYTNFIGTMRGHFSMMNHGEYYILMQNNSRNKEKSRSFKEHGT